MMRIGIFPGVFNPFRKQHKHIVLSLLDQKHLDQIWILPVTKSREKKNLPSTQIRRFWCQLQCRDDPRIHIIGGPDCIHLPAQKTDKNERDRKRYEKRLDPSTVGFWHHLQQCHPNKKIFLIIGMDHATWIENQPMDTSIRIIVQQLPVFVVPRAGYDVIPNWCRVPPHCIADVALYKQEPNSHP